MAPAGPIVIPDETGEEDSSSVLDPGFWPAVLEFDRRPLESTSRWAGSRWLPGVQLTVGPVVLALADVERPDASLSGSPPAAPWTSVGHRDCCRGSGRPALSPWTGSGPTL